MSVVEALAREAGSVGMALHRLSEAQWRAPTRCDPMTVLDLVAHMLRGAQRITDMLDADPIDDEPQKDAVTYFRYDPVAIAPGVVSRAQEDARRFASTAGVVREWDEGWSRALRGARAAGDPVLPTPFGTMRLAEYLRTRVLEVTIHHMDLDDALARDVHPDAEALEITGDILRGLLGTDLRASGVDDVRFALTGTGRAPLDERERELLGPLAERFPLLA